MNLLFWVLYIILALFIGSLLNVVAIRIASGQSIVFPASFCINCKISTIYLISELLTLSTFLLIPYYFRFSMELVIAYPFAMVMIVVALSDLQYKIIPNVITYPAIILFFLLRIFIHEYPLYIYLLAAFVVSVFLFILAILSRGGVGGGDIKLFFLIGLVLGWQNTLLALFLSATLGAVSGGILMLLRVVKAKQLIPYGPFIFIGSFIAYFWGNELVKWYLSFF